MAIAHSLHNLARVLGAQGRYRAAQQLFRQTLALRHALGAGEDPDGATILNNLAVVLGNAGAHTAAEALFRDVLTTRRRLLGADHPWVAQTLYSLAWLQHDAGDLEAAAHGYRLAIDLLSDVDHPASTYPQVALGRVAVDRGDARTAITVLGPALRQLREAHPDGHWRIAHAESLLGAALLLQGDHQQARPLIERGHTVLRQQRGGNAPRTRRAAARLAAVE